jgi:hypothetical protein
MDGLALEVKVILIEIDRKEAPIHVKDASTNLLF